MKFPPFAAVALLLLASCGQQQTSMCGDLLMPPDRYYHSPDAPVRLIFVPWNDLPVTCAAMNDHINDVQACYRSFPPAIILPDPDGVKTTMAEDMCLEIHEIGHEEGWPADHPDARKM